MLDFLKNIFSNKKEPKSTVLPPVVDTVQPEMVDNHTENTLPEVIPPVLVQSKEPEATLPVMAGGGWMGGDRQPNRAADTNKVKKDAVVVPKHGPLKANLPPQPNVGTNQIKTGSINVGSTFISTVNNHLEIRNQPDNEGSFVKIKAGLSTRFNDLTTKVYVDAAIDGYVIQATADAATIGTNVNLPTAVENGDALDQFILFTGQLIMIKDQTDATQNGIYVVSQEGAPTRYAAADMKANTIFYVSQGIINHETLWKVVGTFTGAGGIPVYGTDAIHFVPVVLTPGGGGGTINLSGTSPIVVTNPSAGTYGVSFANSGVTAGTYNTVTVDPNGIITFGTNVPYSGSGTVTEVDTGAGLTGGPITTNGTISMLPTGVTAGTYQGLVVNNLGQITAATNENYGTGTVTNIATGTGLVGGPITNNGTIAVGSNAINYNLIQQVSANKLLGNPSASPANVTEIGIGNGLILYAGLLDIQTESDQIIVDGFNALALADTAVTPGTYGNGSSYSTFTVDSHGRITAASSVPISSGFFWNNVTTTAQAMVPQNGYVASNAALTTMTLPTTCAFGQIIAVASNNAGGWQIAQNTGQTIHFGNQNSTTGNAGFLASNNKYDYVELLCIVANTDFMVKASIGDITVL